MKDGCDFVSLNKVLVPFWLLIPCLKCCGGGGWFPDFIFLFTTLFLGIANFFTSFLPVLFSLFLFLTQLCCFPLPGRPETIKDSLALALKTSE